MALSITTLFGILSFAFIIVTAVIGNLGSKLKNRLHKVSAGLSILFAVLHLLKVYRIF